MALKTRRCSHWRARGGSAAAGGGVKGESVPCRAPRYERGAMRATSASASFGASAGSGVVIEGMSEPFQRRREVRREGVFYW